MSQVRWKGKVLHYPASGGIPELIVVQLHHVHDDGHDHLIMQFPGTLVTTVQAILASVVDHYPTLVGGEVEVTSVEKIEVPTSGDPRMN